MDTIFNWLKGRVVDYVLRNWKTTVVGLVGAVLVQYIKDEQTRAAILAAIVAGLGLLSKDAGTTGTVDQPREDTGVVVQPQVIYVDPTVHAVPDSAHEGP